MSSYQKNNFPQHAAPDYVENSADGGSRAGYESTLRNGRVRNPVAGEGRDISGLDSYRRWLNRVQSPDKRRSPMDPALYTWKGYRSWSDKIRRDWKHDE
jgi:hypothetical protein